MRSLVRTEGEVERWGGCLEGLIVVIEVFESTHPLQAMLEGRGGVSHGRLVRLIMVACFRCWCLVQSVEGSDDGSSRGWGGVREKVK